MTARARPWIMTSITWVMTSITASSRSHLSQALDINYHNNQSSSFFTSLASQREWIHWESHYSDGEVTSVCLVVIPSLSRRRNNHDSESALIRFAHPSGDYYLVCFDFEDSSQGGDWQVDWRTDLGQRKSFNLWCRFVIFIHTIAIYNGIIFHWYTSHP